MLNQSLIKKLVPLILLVAVVVLAYANYKQELVPLIPLPVIFGYPAKTNLLLSPDGKRLAYCAPFDGTMTIWLKTIGLNDDRPLVRDKNQWINHYYWMENGNQILYPHDEYGDENTHLFLIDLPTGEVRDVTPFGGIKASILSAPTTATDTMLLAINKDKAHIFDVHNLDLNTKELSPVAKNPGNIIEWIPDSEKVIRGALQLNDDGSQTLLARNNAEDEWRPLLHFPFEDLIKDELYNGILGFSFDGSVLYLNSSLDTNTRSLLQVDIATGHRTILATDPEYDIDYVRTIGRKGFIVGWEKQRAHYILLSENEKLQKDFERIKTLSDGDLYSIHRSSDMQKWLVGFRHDDKSYDYYLYDRKMQQAEFLYDWRPELNRYPLAKMHPIQFYARDGLKIEGYITYPLYTEPRMLPLVLYVHGGPFMRDEWGYESTVQFLANRGYACLQVNYRGSAGYGKKFLNAGNKEWGGKMQDDLVDAVNWAIKEGIADPKRIAIYGLSYGGYAALVAATFTPELFTCAIDYCGPSNLCSLLESLPPYWSVAQWENRIGCRKDVEFLKSRSPLYKLDQLKIPLLIAHGAYDVRVKQSESEQVVQALKEKGIPYEYFLAPNEGHGFVRSENRLKYYRMIETFLAQHLGGRAQDE